ncbi:MAG TPA: DUF4010 domain-containing protein [Candidatus Acidoferrales bacterium]|nr:DUF4010 domain-containing protein [Candidatus Acidoferrales bacterium]
MSAFLNADAERFALLIGLSLFFGFAFEEFYCDLLPERPGGVRTFPLLALAGGSLYLIDRQHAGAFIAGLIVVGAWTYGYLRHQLRSKSEQVEGTFIIPTANLLAYVLGAIVITQPLWLSVGVTVAAVLLLSGREALHELARRVPRDEVSTAGKFLILVGIVLPLLAGLPKIPYTSVTPFGVWLAVVAVSTISYGSYLLQRYVFPSRGTALGAILGGLYSSTATTVVLARRARAEGMTPELGGGIVLATAMMYPRILAVSAIFDAPLARVLVVPLLVPSAVGFLVAWLASRATSATKATEVARNPLQLETAFLFAALLIAISLLTTFVRTHLGAAGVLGLAAVVGFTDIDPFVLSLAQGGVAQTGLAIAALAIVIASASNNVLKSLYAALFSRRRESWVPAASLIGLGAIAIVLGAIATR